MIYMILRVISPLIVSNVIRRIQVNRIFSWIDNDFYRIAIKRVIDSKWNFNQNLLIVWTTCKWSDGEWWLLLDKFFTWLVWWSPFYWFEFTLKQTFHFCQINFRNIEQNIYDRQYSTSVFTMTARCKTHRTTENNSFQRIDAGIEWPLKIK